MKERIADVLRERKKKLEWSEKHEVCSSMRYEAHIALKEVELIAKKIGLVLDGKEKNC